MANDNGTSVITTIGEWFSPLEFIKQFLYPKVQIYNMKGIINLAFCHVGFIYKLVNITCLAYITEDVFNKLQYI